MKRFHPLAALRRDIASYVVVHSGGHPLFRPRPPGEIIIQIPVMKTLQRLLLAGFALASTAALRAEVSAQAWLETYYLDPQPAELPRAVQNLSREGYFDRAENTAVAIGFLGTVFAKHPDRVDGWMQQLAQLPAKHQRLLAAALWQAGNPLASDLLRKHGQTSPVRTEVEKLASMPSQRIADTPVRSTSSMRLQWGAFLASGDERHIVSILDAFGLNEPALNSAARMSLAQNAAAHPRVMEICHAQLERQPEEIRSELRAALNQAATISPRS